MTHSTITSKGQTTLPAPTGFYEHSRSKTVELLTHLLSCPGFQSGEQRNMLHALKLFGLGKMDFVDCYLAAVSICDGQTVVSFDKDFAKLHGVILQKPGDPL